MLLKGPLRCSHVAAGRVLIARRRSSSHRQRQGSRGLKRNDPVAEGGDLLVLRQSVVGVSDPSGREPHDPFHELGCWSWPFAFVQEVQECGGWCFPSGDVFPSGDGSGVASPAVKMPSIRCHSVSGSACLLGEPSGP